MSSVAYAIEPWVAYAVKVVGVRAAAFIGLLLAGLATALIAAGIAAWIARLDQKHREEAKVGAMAFAVFFLPMLFDAVPWPPIRGFLPYLFFVAIAVLFNDLRRVGQWLALGIGMLLLADEFSSHAYLPPGQAPLSSGPLHETLGLVGILALFFGPKLVGEFLRPGPGGESFWHLSRWTSYDLFLMFFFLIASAMAVGQMKGQNQWLVSAAIAVPVALLIIYMIVKDGLWHPGRWWRPTSAYQVGLLAVAGSVLLVGLGGDAGQTAGVLLFLAGVIMTLFGNLRHPLQWLAAGGGLALVAGAFVVPDELRNAPIGVGMLTILFAPRLIGSYLERRQRAAGERVRT